MFPVLGMRTGPGNVADCEQRGRDGDTMGLASLQNGFGLCFIEGNCWHDGMPFLAFHTREAVSALGFDQTI